MQRVVLLLLVALLAAAVGLVEEHAASREAREQGIDPLVLVPGVATRVVHAEHLRAIERIRLRARCGTQDLEWFNQNILVDAQARTVDLPVALNDPTGTYEVSFIDLFTNQPTTAELTVR